MMRSFCSCFISCLFTLLFLSARGILSSFSSISSSGLFWIVGDGFTTGCCPSLS